MEQINYQSYSDSTGFKPIQETDRSGGIARENQRQQNAEQAYATALANNNQQKVANSKLVGQDLLDLSKFSKKLTEVTTQIYKQTEDDIMIGELYEALVNPGYLETDEAVQEQAVVQQQADTASVAAGAVAEAEQSGQPAVASYIRSNGELTAAGYRGERGALMTAQGTYGPWMQAYTSSDAQITVNGQTMTMREAMASGNPAITSTAVAQARYQFIRQNGLQNASKTQFVRYMQSVMPNVDLALTNNAISTAVKGQRDETRSQLDGNAFTSTQSSETDTASLQNIWNQQAERYWQDGGYATRGEANRAALDGMIKGMIARGDVEGLENLRDVLKVEGQEGSQLGGQYGDAIDQAIVNAQRRRSNNQSQAEADIEASMYEQLADDSLTPAQRDTIIERAAQDLERAGNYRAARALRQERDDLTVDGSSQRNAAELSQRITAGEITSQRQLQQELQRGNITASQYSQLSAELTASTGTKAPDNEFANDLVRRELNAFEIDFLQAAGISRDASGRLIAQVSGETELVSAGDAERIIAQAEADMNLLVNATLTRLGPGASDAEVRAAVTAELVNWRNTEVQSAGGRYRLDDILDARRGTAGRESNFATQARENKWADRFKPLTSAEAGSYVPPRYSTRQNLTERTTSGGWTTQNASDFSGIRGDVVIPRDQLDAYREQYEEGQISPELQTLSTTLGLSPLALLQQQSGAYGIAPLDPFSGAGTSTGEAYNGKLLTAYEGAQLIMTQGVPARGAAWLSGNIQQESSWNGRRTWGEVAGDGSDRNGGLVSWMDGVQHNNFRLTKIEKYLGKPIAQATNSEQVAAMLWEMQKDYPAAYKTFMNPYATDRQLIDASIAYWGYGHEGGRYEYARSTEQQLQG